MAADIDVRAIANFSALSEATVKILLDNPTKELVASLLATIAEKAKEYEQFKTQKVRLEVELETHVRTSESKAKVLQNSRDKALAEVSKLRVDVQNAENARSRVEVEIEQARQSNSGEVSEIGSLKSRISSLETSNRDTLSLLDSKTSAYDRLSQELSAQHQKVVELRKQASSLEQSNQAANSAVSSAKFREQSLQQELDLQKKNNEWLENERKIKFEEHTAFRKEKNARISELSRSNEQYIEEAETLRRSDVAMKTRIDEQINKHEELLQQIQKLREKEIAEADSHRIELDSVNRLAQLQEASANTAKQRVQELSVALEEAKEEAADEIGRIRAEVEAEHQDKEAAEQRITELEVKINELEGELEQARVQPATPRRDPHHNGLSTPQRPGTPGGIFSPSFSARLKGGSSNLTMSQLYGEYKNIERELSHEKRLNAELQNNIDSMLEDLETKRPEIEELRDDQTRLQSEVFEMSALVETANHERDDAVKEIRILRGHFEAASKELEECKQTLRDRNSQLRWLIMDREAREQGQSLSEEGFTELQKAAADADERDTEHLSDTQRIVNQQLVLFKSISDMQQQNENQLVTIRRLVAQLESAEARETQQQNLQLKEELESSKSRIAEYQAEIQHMVTQSKYFVKERDTFKSMLTRRGQLPAHVDPVDFSRSMPLPAGGSPSRVREEGSTSGVEEYAKLLKDLQTHFDNYRQESSTNTSALRTQISELTKRNTQLQTEVSKSVGQLSAANSRSEMLQANFNMLKNESAEMQKRSYTLMEAATKQEMKTQQAAEELVEARGLLDGLRRESANLKAEKDLWKSIEQRLIGDNEALRNERGRLDQLNSSLQNILNEREQTDSEARRRLQSQVESLENELQSNKRKLNDELEESKNLAARREYEHEQNQKRIDDLVASLGTTREEMASAKTGRDHLQARVDELTVELRSAEGRLEVLTRPAAESADQANGIPEDSQSREQELSVEVSDLKRDLELKTIELERSHEQIETYKDIAQSAEERMLEISETNDQFKEETEASIAEKDSRIKDLEQRIEDISSELNTSNSELTKLRDEQSESNRKLDEQKSRFETDIARLKEGEERSLEQAQFNLEASKAQAQIATEAQQNYENELLKHAEAAKNLHVIRAEANQLRLEMVDLKSQADIARGDLEQKETSWSEMKDRYEREIADLKKRRDEIAQQNSLLHGQLEGLTQQITTLQRDRAALATDNHPEDANDNNVKELGSLQEVIKYLRREKEIVDVQYHLSTQEAKRLRQQLEFAQTQLDDTRLKLDQQRRAEADTERNAMSHNKLMDTLNELNLFRESSVTLRAEAKQATQALADKTKKVDELNQQIQPLQARIAELENLGELREGEMKLLQDDRDHWQQRCQNILSKYDRVDPAELESLKSRLTSLEGERDEAVAGQAALQSQIDAHPGQIEAARTDLRNRLADQFKSRSAQLTGRIKDKQVELDTSNAEKETLQTELDAVKAELEVSKAHGNNSTQQKQAEPADSGSEHAARIAELEAKIAELESNIAAKDQELASTTQQQDEKFKAREIKLKELLNKRLAEVKQEAQNAKESALEDLKQKLTAEHQQGIEALRAQSVPVAADLQNVAQPAPATNPNPADSTSPSAVPASFEQLLESITDDQAKQLVQHHKTIRSIVTANIRKVADREKEALRAELAANAPAATEDAAAPSTEEMESKFEAKKEAIIQQKEQEFAVEREKMVKDFEERLEAERQSLVEQQARELASEKLEFSKESERKIAEQVANAQALAEKRASVKLNMAQGRAAVATAKIEVVAKAADETPDRPVKEVWDIAKSAKPIPQQQQTQPKSVVPPSPSTNKAAAPIVAATPVTATATAVDTKANGAEPNGNSEAGQVEPKTEASDPAVQGGVSETPAQQNAGAGPVGTSHPKTSLPQPRGAFRGASNAQSRGGAQQTQATRGTGIPRGRGGGRGAVRGGLQTGIPSAPGPTRGGGNTGSPVRGPLNPGAQQFVPGGKRARDDGDGNQDGNAGKRIRGGGNAGGA